MTTLHLQFTLALDFPLSLVMMVIRWVTKLLLLLLLKQHLLLDIQPSKRNYIL